MEAEAAEHMDPSSTGVLLRLESAEWQWARKWAGPAGAAEGRAAAGKLRGSDGIDSAGKHAEGEKGGLVGGDDELGKSLWPGRCRRAGPAGVLAAPPGSPCLASPPQEPPRQRQAKQLRVSHPRCWPAS